MQTFGSWFKIPVVRLIIQAIIFASVHPYSILGVINVFISGLFFGLLAWKTNGLEAGSAVHSVNNFIRTIIVSIGIDVATSMVTPQIFVETIVAQTISIIAIYYFGNKYGWFDKKTSEDKLI